jgi:carbonic anhydrase
LQNDGEWLIENELLTLVNDWGSIEADGTTYVIYEIRLTSPSEHTVGSSGYRYPLELQAYAISNEETYLGLIMFFEEGDENDFLTGVGMSADSELVDLTDGQVMAVSEYYSLSWLFDDDMKILYYDGSMTFPPCNEILWVISYDVQSASKAQINSFPSELVG